MIPSDFQRYIRSNEFKTLLAKVQEAIEHGAGEYFDADDLVDVAEYFHVKGDEPMAGKVVDYLLSLFPDNEKGLVFKARTAIMSDRLEEAENISRLLVDAEIVDAPTVDAIEFVGVFNAPFSHTSFTFAIGMF